MKIYNAIDSKELYKACHDRPDFLEEIKDLLEQDQSCDHKTHEFIHNMMFSLIIGM